ncbi:MAG TPA: hypothetical protein DEP69_03265 [Acidimicrobiaceae bacterium]|nr:hypothetical protein [Acidimicrobiaceae bacterium]
MLRAAGEQAVVVLDDNRLADRAVAYRAGLGWFGRNTMLLHPDLGSWTVLGSVVTTAALPADAAPVPDGCGSCRRCVPACPTGALGTDASGAAVLDADLCLAWQLQADGVFARGLRVALGDRLYGCDDCQVVCPCNDEPSPAAGSAGPAADASSGAPHDWAARRGDNPLSVRGRTAIDVAEMLLASDDALTAAFGHWYIPRRRPEYLRRNALVVLGNTADAAAAPTREALRACLRDASPIVRSHAVWAAHRLGLGGLVAEVPAGLLLADDPDGMVALELRDPPAAAPPRPRT